MPQQPPPPGQSPKAPLSAQGRRVPITEAPAHCPSFCPNQLPMPSLVPSLPCEGTSSCFSKAVEERTTQILSSSGPGSRGEGSAAGHHCPWNPPALDIAVAVGMTYGQQVAPVQSGPPSQGAGGYPWAVGGLPGPLQLLAAASWGGGRGELSPGLGHPHFSTHTDQGCRAEAGLDPE